MTTQLLMFLCLGLVGGWAITTLWYHSFGGVKASVTTADMLRPVPPTMTLDEVHRLANHVIVKTVDKKFAEMEERLTRNVMFGVVAACRAEMKPMTDDVLHKTRMRMWVKTNQLYEFTQKYHPVLDMPEPPQ